MTMPARSLALLLAGLLTAQAEIPRPADAPRPLSPAEAVNSFHLPPGYTMKLVASEPLIHEPSGVCWDEHGRMFVCELHGYNVEGQYDIEELNQKGELDLQVRRIQASESAKEKARPDNYGTVKMLRDTDGDGVMDKAVVWADRLPLCYGVVPARGGIIVACPPDIVYLADKDGDGRAEVRETLFTGFGVGQPERGVNAPTWGVDNWIYLGRGHSGGTITGPHLAKPVVIGNTDFRIRADGSAIEPVTGSAKTIGMAFTEGGDRFVTTTTSPGMLVTPISPRDYERNPDAAAPLADRNAAAYNQCYPRAPAHPWRIKREQHAEYFAFYKKISLSDAAASGYFTSVCSPLVYQDSLLEGLQGQYLVCEPAQNLVHRARIERDGAALRLTRLPEEAKSEFLASSDSWFHPVGLQPAPDGSIAVVDFYREIIEDYSAIPRHLQQQYGVINGHDRGRIWLLTKTGHQPVLSQNMADESTEQLMARLDNGTTWQRLTARRLLIERRALDKNSTLALPGSTAGTLALLHVLEGCQALTPERLLAAWQHPAPEMRVHALCIAEGDFAGLGRLVEESLMGPDTPGGLDARVILQSALSLGSSRSPRAQDALTSLARDHGDVAWMDAAVASSCAGQEAALLLALAARPGKAAPVMDNLAGVVAARADASEIDRTLKALEARSFQGRPLDLLKLGLQETQPLASGGVALDIVAPGVEAQQALEKRLPDFMTALKAAGNAAEGRFLFTAACSTCHRSHGIGMSVGPDLDAEFQRAPEVILRDILFPHEAQRPGYETVKVRTQRGETLFGIAASDSPTSITLRLPGGMERTVLRKRATISTLRNLSLMPSGLGEALTPEQIANIIAFLRQPAGAGR